MSEVKQSGQKVSLAEQGSSSRAWQKKKVYGHRKTNWVTREGYTDTVLHCKEKIHVANGVVEDHDCSNDKLPANAELVQDLLFLLDT